MIVVIAGGGSVGRFIADALRAAGVRYAFTVPGESFLGLLDAFEGADYALNMSLTTVEPATSLVRRLAPLLLQLKQDILHALSDLER